MSRGPEYASSRGRLLFFVVRRGLAEGMRRAGPIGAGADASRQGVLPPRTGGGALLASVAPVFERTALALRPDPVGSGAILLHPGQFASVLVRGGVAVVY